MADRIINVRSQIHSILTKNLGSKQDWVHLLTKLQGIFAYFGISSEQIDKLVKEYHVYLTKDGCISVSGLTPKNIEHFATSLHEVTR